MLAHQGDRGIKQEEGGHECHLQEGDGQRGAVSILHIITEESRSSRKRQESPEALPRGPQKASRDFSSRENELHRKGPCAVETMIPSLRLGKPLLRNGSWR